MSDHWDTINEWAKHASTFRKLKAYGVSANGTRQHLDCDAIAIELDEERSLIVSLAERIAGEGVAICSLPQGDSSKFSLIVMRSGGANLLYLSPELHGPGG
jgi:hypothetical protein